MDTEEKQLLNDILNRMNQVEEKIKLKNNDKSEKKERSTFTMIFQIIFRSFLVALVAFALGDIYMTYIGNHAENKPFHPNKQVVVGSDTSTPISKSLTKDNRKMIIQKSLDSLNSLFLDEVSGTGPTKVKGYGPKAISFKRKIDSIKLELKK